MTPRAPSLSIIVPALDEAERLPRLLDDLGPLGCEVVVVDGGSTDRTVRIATSAGARVVSTRRGRGHQLRAGAAATTSEWLLFLHADSRLPAESRRALEVFLTTAATSDFAHFTFSLDGARPVHRFIEFGQRLRERLFGLVYGDQGLLVSRALYEKVGGFPEWEIMEDVGLVDRLRRVGKRTALSAKLPTSARRYDAEGGIRAWLRNATLIMAFQAGADPARLARWYRPHSAPTGQRGVIVFAKAPVAGRVKTRLAATVGDEEAVRIYRRLAQDTVAGLRGGPWRLFVYVDALGLDEVESVREWLGPDGIEYRLQGTGDLGARMSEAFEECLAECAEVCIVGTDLPGMGAGSINQAFDSLARGDVVLGPATDGGYYLMALRSAAPSLFADVLWSTDTVLSATLERSARAGLRCVLLDPRTDVDTVDDVPAELLAE